MELIPIMALEAPFGLTIEDAIEEAIAFIDNHENFTNVYLIVGKIALFVGNATTKECLLNDYYNIINNSK